MFTVNLKKIFNNENIILDVYVNDWLLLDPETLPM